jgi:hypothetical protein
MQHVDARRDIAEALLGARGRDRHLFEQLGRRQHDLHRLREIGHALLLFGKAACPHDDGRGTGLCHVNGEAAVCACRHALFGAGLDPDDDRRAGNHPPARVLHDARERGCR